MCGISGLLTTDDASYLRSSAWTLGCLDHRGPDARGWLTARPDGVSLGRGLPPSSDAPLTILHTRLSIIDLSDAGIQPMATADGRYWVAYNGEIYSYRELQRELEALGHTFRSHSDTEVLLAAITTWGIKTALERSVGMFAIALWDREQRTLTMARDRLGEKPLYYGWLGNTLVFGSDMASFYRHPDWRGEVDRNALALLMRQRLPGLAARLSFEPPGRDATPPSARPAG